MRILFLHQYFKLPEQGGGIRSYYLAKSLVEKGHEVTIITTHNKPQKEYKNIEGANVICLPIYYSNELSYFQRIKTFLSYFFDGLKESKTVQKDFVYAISTPLTTGLLALIIGKPFVFEVGDLWPAVPEQMGIVKNKIFLGILKRLEKRIYSKSRLIVSMSTDIKRIIQESCSQTPNIVIPNFSDLEIFDRNSNNRISDSQNHNKIICAYTGTAGKANDLIQILNLAEVALKDAPNIQFFIMCEGMETEIIANSKLNNVEFLGYSNKNDAAKLMNAAHFNIVCYAQYPLLGTGSPNKYFDGLSSGCVTIINVEGWIKNEIEMEDIGLFWDVNKPMELIEKILKLYSDQEKIKMISKKSRALAGNKYDWKILSAKLNDYLMIYLK